MKIDEAIQLLQNEINWCLDHPDPELTHDQRMGFVNGLKQAQYLLRSAEQKCISESFYSRCICNKPFGHHGPCYPEKEIAKKGDL